MEIIKDIFPKIFLLLNYKIFFSELHFYLLIINFKNPKIRMGNCKTIMCPVVDPDSQQKGELVNKDEV